MFGASYVRAYFPTGPILSLAVIVSLIVILTIRYDQSSHTVEQQHRILQWRLNHEWLKQQAAATTSPEHIIAITGMLESLQLEILEGTTSDVDLYSISDHLLQQFWSSQSQSILQMLVGCITLFRLAGSMACLVVLALVGRSYGLAIVRRLYDVPVVAWEIAGWSVCLGLLSLSSSASEWLPLGVLLGCVLLPLCYCGSKLLHFNQLPDWIQTSYGNSFLDVFSFCGTLWTLVAILHSSPYIAGVAIVAWLALLNGLYPSLNNDRNVLGVLLILISACPVGVFVKATECFGSLLLLENYLLSRQPTFGKRMIATGALYGITVMMFSERMRAAQVIFVLRAMLLQLGVLTRT